MTVAGAFLAFAMNAVNGFVFVYASRELGLTAQAGLHLGIIAIIAGGTGISVSGYRWSRWQLFAALIQGCDQTARDEVQRTARPSRITVHPDGLTYLADRSIRHSFY